MKYLCISFIISTIGIIENARARAIEYSTRLIGVNPKALAKNGISITAVVAARDATADINIYGFPLF